jgi:hypothetical protein
MARAYSVPGGGVSVPSVASRSGVRIGPPTFCAVPSRLHIFRIEGLKNSVSQMIYKHAISTVVPARNVRLSEEENE